VFLGGGGLAKKNTAVFPLEYFFSLVRWSARGSATGNKPKGENFSCFLEY